jgi:hypothetical protein
MGRGTVGTGCLSIVIIFTFITIGISQKYYEKPLYWVTAAPLLVMVIIIIKGSIKKG